MNSAIVPGRGFCRIETEFSTMFFSSSVTKIHHAKGEKPARLAEAITLTILDLTTGRRGGSAFETAILICCIRETKAGRLPLEDARFSQNPGALIIYRCRVGRSKPCMLGASPKVRRSPLTNEPVGTEVS